MNINATLLGQMITFAVFVGFTMKYVWPPITQALATRQKKIAEGIAAAEQSVHALEVAQHKVAEQMRDAKLQAAKIVEQAQKRASQVVEEAKLKAREEGLHLIHLAKDEIAQEVQTAKTVLRQHVASIAMQGASKILERNIDSKTHQELIDKIIAEI